MTQATLTEFVECSFGDRVATCYHTPRCAHIGDASGPFGHYVPVPDPDGTDCLSEAVIAGGQCTQCEHDSAELIPWTTDQRLCWDCVDFQLDLLALAVQDILPVEVKHLDIAVGRELTAVAA
jgi:hypothetical protein